jgi:hypothetical protein
MLRLNVYGALLSAVVLAVAGINTARANVVLNGGFEISSGISQLSDPGTGGYSSLNNWSVGVAGPFATYALLFNGSSADTAGSYSPSFGQVVKLHGPNTGVNNGYTGSPDGGNFVALGSGSSFRGTGISQTLAGLVAGSSYDVSFFWAVGNMSDLNNAGTSSLKVQLGSSPSQSTSTVSTAGNGFSSWLIESFNFTAASSTETLKFLAEGSWDGPGPLVLLDGVSVYASTLPAAVPEPGTVGLLACALAGAGAFRLRRRAQAKAI